MNTDSLIEIIADIFEKHGYRYVPFDKRQSRALASIVVEKCRTHPTQPVANSGDVERVAEAIRNDMQINGEWYLDNDKNCKSAAIAAIAAMEPQPSVKVIAATCVCGRQMMLTSPPAALTQVQTGINYTDVMRIFMEIHELAMDENDEVACGKILEITTYAIAALGHVQKTPESIHVNETCSENEHVGQCVAIPPNTLKEGQPIRVRTTGMYATSGEHVEVRQCASNQMGDVDI